MSRLVIAPKARTDLAGAWRYSFDRWGRPQADSYLGRLQEVMATIAEDPRRGLPCDDLRAGYRRISAGSHVIFFRMWEDDVYVVRVLHQRMNFAHHLNVAAPLRRP